MKPDMTDDEKKAFEAFAACRDVRLPDGFAARLVRRVREKREKAAPAPLKATFARLALLAASLTLILGFVRLDLRSDSDRISLAAACRAELRAPVGAGDPGSSQLRGLALLGFCREAVRRRVRPLVRAFRKRADGKAED